MDGIRRIDEMSLFTARIPGPRRLRPAAASRAGPSPSSRRSGALLGLVDGRSTVAEIAARAHLSEFDATKILYHLAEAGYVEAVGAAGGRRPGPRVRAIVGGMNELFRLVSGAIPEADAPASAPAYAASWPTTSHPLAPVWARAAHTEDGALDQECLLGNLAAMKGGALSRLEPSGDPARLLLAALRELLFFHLFLAGRAAVPARPTRRSRGRPAQAAGAGGAAARDDAAPLRHRRAPRLRRHAAGLARGLPRGRGAGLPAVGRAAPTSTCRWRSGAAPRATCCATLARALGVPERDAGYAGLKDRDAVTTQWLSFPVARDPDPAQPGRARAPGC